MSIRQTRVVVPSNEPAVDWTGTLFHLLGMDHKRLTYFYNGRNMRLTDVAEELIPQIVA